MLQALLLCFVESESYPLQQDLVNQNITTTSIPSQPLFDSATRVKKCKRGWFAYPSTHTAVGLALEAFGEWDEEAITVFEHYVKPGYVVVDVGGHIGAYAIVFGQLVGKLGMVHAFEPQTRLFQLLNTNIVLNDQVYKNSVFMFGSNLC